MAELPDGVVTFLFTDVEGSTRMWEESPDSMMTALNQHDEVIDGAVNANNGVSVKPRGEGDSRFVVFGQAADAVEAVVDMQRRLGAIDWPTPDPLRVRASLHTGTADLQLGDYYGSAVNRAARLRAIAHGGQTVMSAATWELVRDRVPDGVTFRDMGEHRLKDLTRPERVFQIVLDELPDRFPPLASLDATRNNLPVQLTEFVGREVELEDAKRAISRTRLLTITAPGGAGKTRLAIQVAADLAADFPDGVFFVDLSPISSPADIPQTVAESMGIALSSDQDLRSQLLSHLANERLLLVLDNFEHLTEGTAIVTEILRAAPHVKVIVSSRTKLNVSGETVLTVSGLDARWDTQEEALRTSGVRLFVDAATRVDARFSLSSDDLDPLARVLELVEGIPLGILLAAAWVDVLRLDEIASEIEKSLDFLETDMGDTPGRHRSVRAVFDYSWSLLSEEERRNFAALSVFRGGFTREAAEEVAGASLRNLTSLVGKSLVVADRDSGRYSVHELLRQYAEEELRKDPVRCDETIVAHNTFFAEQVGRFEELLMLGDGKPALDLVESDLDNIRSAWRQTLARGEARTARPIALGLWFLYEIRGWPKAGVELFAEAREAIPDDSGDETIRTVRAIAASVEAKFLANLGRPDDAAPLATQAVEVLRHLPDRFALVAALESLCEITAYFGNPESVLALSMEAIQISDESGYAIWSAAMKNYQAGAYLQIGDLDTAERLLVEADEVLSRFGEQFARTWNLEMQAMIAMMQDRVGDAIDLRSRQVELAHGIGYVRAVAIALQGLGEAHAATGDVGAASEAFVESLDMFQHMGLIVDVGTVMVLIARLRAETGAGGEAVEILACLLADPVSNQQSFSVTRQMTLSEPATALLAELDRRLDPGVYASAHERGAAKALDIQVKELIAARRDSGGESEG
jgi:predicted ATPase/class 3 adenylate cyclase